MRDRSDWQFDVSKLLRRLNMMPRLWKTEMDIIEHLLKESSISTLTERSLCGNMTASFRFLCRRAKRRHPRGPERRAELACQSRCKMAW
jgi:hypothetical protein